MANFDSNSWHRITVADGQYPSYCLNGSQLFQERDTVGAVEMGVIDTEWADQYWQIFRYNTTFYVLRTMASSDLGYLGVQFDKNEITPGKTIPVMRNVSVSDDSMFWKIGPWGDGTFWLSNGANGSEWRLAVKVPYPSLAMSSNITAPQNGQRFSFEQLDTIDDVAWSSVITPTPVPSSSSSTTISSIFRSASSIPPMTTITATATAMSTPSRLPQLQEKEGISKGTAAAIGASIGGVALVAILAFVFILIRRRKKEAKANEQAVEPPTAQLQPKELPAEQVSSRHLSTEVPAYSTT